jgi:hypothetical protein
LGIALPQEQLGRDGEVAQFGKAAGHIGNVFVHTKNFRNHQHHRQIGFARRCCTVGGHFEIAHHDGDLAHR